jgi:iron complex outermembrane recepter protein
VIRRLRFALVAGFALAVAPAGAGIALAEDAGGEGSPIVADEATDAFEEAWDADAPQRPAPPVFVARAERYDDAQDPSRPDRSEPGGDVPQQRADGAPRTLRTLEAIERIMVTARKRRELLDRVPLSVAVISEAALEEQQIRRASDIDVPNVEFTNTFGLTNSARTTIRGVGQFEIAPTTDPGVGIYLDGVYLARPQYGLLSVSDVQRIEVLRGPQGTLFGKNTIGGAINIVTEKPSFSFGGEAELRYGDFDEFGTRLAVDLPIVENRLAARLSVATSTRDGFEERVGDNSDANNEKLLATRLQLRALPMETLEIVLSGDFAKEGKKPQQAACTPTGPIQDPSGVAQMLDAVLGFKARCAETARLQDRRRFVSDVSFVDEEQISYGGAMTVNWELSQNTTLTSISAVRSLRFKLRSDLDGTDIALFQTPVDAGRLKQDQLSQEIQLQSTFMGGRLSTTLGAYAFAERAKNTEFSQNVVAPLPAPFVFALRNGDFRTRNTSYAAFGQGTFNVTDKLSVTAGLRYTTERKRVSRRLTTLTDGISLELANALLGDPGARPAGTIFGFEKSERYDDFSPALSVGYEFNESVYGYLSYSTGFKSGAIDGREALTPVDVDPEDLTTYEVGLKSTLFQNRLSVSASAFFSVYKDIQLLIVDPADISDLTRLVNAGKSEVRGGEVELVAVPIPNLTLRSAVGILDAKYVEFDDFAISTSGLVPLDRDDQDLPFAPNYTLRFSAAYSFPVLRNSLMTISADWLHKGSQFLDVQNSEALKQGKFGELGARIALELGDGATEISLYGKNLLDRDHVASGIARNDLGFALRFLAPPRTYGLEIRRLF